MSVYAQIGAYGDQEQIASNMGWGDFLRWAETLDAAKYPALVTLADEGITEEPGRVRVELEEALATHPPNEDTRDVASQLIAALLAAGTEEPLLVTNGIKLDSSSEETKAKLKTHDTPWRIEL